MGQVALIIKQLHNLVSLPPRYVLYYWYWCSLVLSSRRREDAWKNCSPQHEHTQYVRK